MKIDTENYNSFWRETKVKHMSLKESETRELYNLPKFTKHFYIYDL